MPPQVACRRHMAAVALAAMCPSAARCSRAVAPARLVCTQLRRALPARGGDRETSRPGRRGAVCEGAGACPPSLVARFPICSNGARQPPLSTRAAARRPQILLAAVGWRQVLADGTRCAPAELSVVQRGDGARKGESAQLVLRVAVHEGFNHQARRARPSAEAHACALRTRERAASRAMAML